MSGSSASIPSTSFTSTGSTLLSGRKGSLHELDLPIAIRMLLIDIGGALAPDGGGKVSLEDIRSRPLNALLQGLLAAGVWDEESMPLKGMD